MRCSRRLSHVFMDFPTNPSRPGRLVAATACPGRHETPGTHLGRPPAPQTAAVPPERPRLAPPTRRVPHRPQNLESTRVPQPAISISGLRMSYGETEAVRGIDLEVETGEIFAFLGPNGAGKTTTVEILEGYRKRTGGEVQGAGRGPRARGARLARPDRHRPAVELARSLPDGARVDRALRRLLHPPALGGGDDRAGRAGGESRLAGAQTVRRPAAPARRRHGAGRRPRAALPRRADDRLRPLRPAPVLGGDRGPPRPRQDDLPHHPLHGRGAAARRPGDDHRGRPDRRPGHPGGPRRTREGGLDDPLPLRGRRGGLDRDARPGEGAEPPHR